MDASGLAGAVGKCALAGGRETAGGRGGDVDGLYAGHGGDVDDAGGGGGCCGVEEEGLEADGDVEDGFNVEGHEFVPAGFGEVVVVCAPGGAGVVWCAVSMQVRAWMGW